MDLNALRPDRLPRPLRLAAYAAAAAILLWLCLAPTDDLPGVSLWDKAEHSIAWAVLTGTGLVLSHHRPRAIAAFAFGLGILVELLQATMGFGRQGDWRDLVADSIGIAAALAVWGLIQLVRRR